MGAIRPFEVLRRNFDDPPYVVILCQSSEQPKSTHTGPAEPASEERNVTITQSRGSLGLNRPIRYELTGACRTRTERTRPIGLGGGICGEINNAAEVGLRGLDRHE